MDKVVTGAMAALFVAIPILGIQGITSQWVSQLAGSTSEPSLGRQLSDSVVRLLDTRVVYTSDLAPGATPSALY